MAVAVVVAVTVCVAVETTKKNYKLMSLRLPRKKEVIETMKSETTKKNYKTEVSVYVPAHATVNATLETTKRTTRISFFLRCMLRSNKKELQGGKGIIPMKQQKNYRNRGVARDS